MAGVSASAVGPNLLAAMGLVQAGRAHVYIKAAYVTVFVVLALYSLPFGRGFSIMRELSGIFG